MTQEWCRRGREAVNGTANAYMANTLCSNWLRDIGWIAWFGTVPIMPYFYTVYMEHYMHMANGHTMPREYKSINRLLDIY